MKWNECKDFRDIVITPKKILRYVPRIGQWWPHFPFMQVPTKSFPPLNTADDFPQIIVTCGRRMAGVSIALRERAKRHGAKLTTIHLQDPRLNPALFDMLIVPRHDPARGKNVIVTKAALNRLDQSQIISSARNLPKSWKTATSPRVAVLLGGDNRRYTISNKMADHMADQLRRFARANDATLFLIPSRRCPEPVWHHLQTALENTNCYVTDKHQPNPYPGIFGISDAIIVTSDSVNMVSEASSTGKPVMIAYWTSETGRIKTFHQTMESEGHSLPLTEKLPAHEFVPLRQNDKLRQEISARLTK